MGLCVALTVTIVGCTRKGTVSPTLVPVPTRPRPAQSRDVHRYMVMPTIASINREPTVRVRIAKNTARVQIISGGALLIGQAKPKTNDPNGLTRRFTRAVAITHHQGAFLITDARGQTVQWALPTAWITSATNAPLVFNGRSYPGALVLVPVTDTAGQATGKLDVVNHVGMELYLPGVIEHELYGSWEPTTYRAAAIAARTYAIFESSLNTDKHYDLESTTASQVYGGRSTNPKALKAVASTRGLLLSYHDRIIPAFYSSSCGGTGQDARAAFTWLPGLRNIPPLLGKNHGAWCQQSDKYRWGPVARAKASLALRISSWGRHEGHPVKALRGIRNIRIRSVNSAGRPKAFWVSDHAGLTYTLGAEQFRFACNFNAPGLGKPRKDQTLYSSQVKVQVSASAVTFYDGRGFGHGVGLCQFGAQGLAKAGYNEYSILTFYYPRSTVVRGYP